MKSIAFALLLAAAALAAPQPQPAPPHKIYLLPMAHGFDQYLANRLAASGRFQVLTDPAPAEVVLTDHLGKDFQVRLDQLYPKAPHPAKPEPAAKPAEAAADRPGGDLTGIETSVVPFLSRAKGTIFLVDVKTRAVLWSTYDRPLNTRPDQLDRTASRIADRLRRSFKQK